MRRETSPPSWPCYNHDRGRSVCLCACVCHTTEVFSGQKSKRRWGKERVRKRKRSEREAGPCGKPANQSLSIDEGSQSSPALRKLLSVPSAGGSNPFAKPKHPEDPFSRSPAFVVRATEATYVKSRCLSGGAEAKSRFTAVEDISHE